MAKTYVQASYCRSNSLDRHKVPFFYSLKIGVSNNKSSIIEMKFRDLMKGKFQLTLGYYVFAGVSSITKLGS